MSAPTIREALDGRNVALDWLNQYPTKSTTDPVAQRRILDKAVVDFAEWYSTLFAAALHAAPDKQ